jgi:hypothetical protein
LNIIANDIEELLECVRKYTLYAINNENILLSSSKDKKEKISEIKLLLLDKETKFRAELMRIKQLLNDLSH